MFHIEESLLQLTKLMYLVLGGFTLYVFLPLAFRLQFLLLINMVALVVLFQFTVGLAVLVIGLGMVALASLPIMQSFKVILFLVIGACLALTKMGKIAEGEGYQIASILGGLFMFRMILYLYEIHHEKEKVSIWKRINYFFLLPNLIFWIFPIVDYKTFTRNYYSKPAIELYTKGVLWIFTGCLHLLVYRLIYYYGVTSPTEVNDAIGLLEYLAYSYMLIIRLSGIFHLCAGIICLFGFDLPKTFNHYFLASGFNDLWQRINTYYREFIMKVVYVPIYFQFREKTATATFLTILIVFVLNWFFHAYQWFWIRGSFLISTPDILFWTILGIVLAINSVLLMKSSKRTRSPGFDFSRECKKSLKILGMFTFMCVMWSLWNSPSLTEWWVLLTNIARIDLADAIKITIVLILICLSLVLGFYLHFRWQQSESKFGYVEQNKLLLVSLVLILIVPVGLKPVSDKVEHHYAIDMSSIITSKLNTSDEELLTKGYYENLIASNGMTSRMWEVEEEKKRSKVKWVQYFDAGLMDRSNGILEQTIKPNLEIMFKGSKLTTNEHGMRDRSYSINKPDNTLRIAQLGGSIEMGSGVENHEVFENLLEERLNAESFLGAGQKLEILNFARANSHTPHYIGVVDEVIEKFSPDVLMLYAHGGNRVELGRSMKSFYRVMSLGLVEKYPYLTALTKQLGIKRNTGIEEGLRLLKPVEEELYLWGLKKISEYCDYRKIPCVLVYLDTLSRKKESEKEINNYLNLVIDTGFEIWNLSELFKDHNNSKLTIASWDYHPNKKGHEIISQALYDQFMKNKDLFKFSGSM